MPEFTYDELHSIISSADKVPCTVAELFWAQQARASRNTALSESAYRTDGGLESGTVDAASLPKLRQPALTGLVPGHEDSHYLGHRHAAVRRKAAGSLAEEKPSSASALEAFLKAADMLPFPDEFSSFDPCSVARCRQDWKCQVALRPPPAIGQWIASECEEVQVNTAKLPLGNPTNADAFAGHGAVVHAKEMLRSLPAVQLSTYVLAKLQNLRDCWDV